MEEKKYELIKFNDGDFSLDVNVSPSEDTVWLTKNDISILFDIDRSVVSKHIKKIVESSELSLNSVCAKNAHTASDGKTYIVDYYNLDMIIAVRYRVNSKRGILFRKWTNQVLKQYLLNDYTINEERCIVCSSSILELNNEIKQLQKNY